LLSLLTSIFSSSFFYLSRDHPDLHSFPTRRSSDLTLMTQQCIYFWLASAEIDKCIKCCVFSANCEDIFPKLLSGGGVKNTFIFRSEEHTSELQSRENLVCRLLLEKKNKKTKELSMY